MTAVFYVGDAIEVMSKLPEKSVDLILTSPPFLALRSYLPADHPDKALEGGSQSTPGEFIDWLLDVVEACDRVLAQHGSLCIELGDTYSGSGGAGGDYAGDGQPGFVGSGKLARYSDARGNPDGMRDTTFSGGNTRTGGGTGWPLAKSLSLIPESFRFAMVYGRNPHTGRQTEPWRLRNVIRWVRPNPPVGALGDKFRPATSELMVFCKSAKRYFDLDAVRVPYSDDMQRLIDGRTIRGTQRSSDQDEGIGSDWTNRKGFVGKDAGGAPPLDWWNIPLLEGEEPRKMQPPPPANRPRDRYPDRQMPSERNRTLINKDTGARGDDGKPRAADLHPLGSPPLDWWNIPPGGYEGAHYAVFPPELCVKPVKAMCPEKVCRVCGEPSRRIVNYSYDSNDPSAWGTGAGWVIRPSTEGQNAEPRAVAATESSHNPSAQSFAHGRAAKIVNTLGFSDCGHDDWRPGLVLDPFAGSGTTLAVATGHGRDAIGIDLDFRNFDLALERVGPFILSRGSFDE